MATPSVQRRYEGIVATFSPSSFLRPDGSPFSKGRDSGDCSPKWQGESASGKGPDPGGRKQNAGTGQAAGSGLLHAAAGDLGFGGLEDFLGVVVLDASDDAEVLEVHGSFARCR